MAITFFKVGCLRVFETHQNKAETVRLEDSTALYELPNVKNALALSSVSQSGFEDSRPPRQILAN